jgi:hypothetical protein
LHRHKRFAAGAIAYFVGTTSGGFFPNGVNGTITST